MAEFEKWADAAGTKKDNEQSRIISEFIPYNGSYKRITSIEREGGIWCNCGGASQSVVLNVYDQMLDGDVLIKTSDTTTCRCYGKGPDQTNYARTTFGNWTQSESDAAIAAWANGTLIIKRFVSIKSYTSPKHGSPVFRDGFYYDLISISGTDEPFTNYGPKVELFDVYRSADGKTEDPESVTVWANVTISMVDNTAFDGSTIQVAYQDGRDPDADSPTIDIKPYFSDITTLGAPTRVKISWTNITFDRGKDYYFQLRFKAGEEVAVSEVDAALRASIPIMISDTNHGVAVGQYSTANAAYPKFECKWPAYFYGGIAQIGSGSGSMMNLLGIQRGVTGQQRVTSGGVKDVTVVFPKPFSSDPTVFVSLNGTLEGSSAGGISAIVRSVNTTEFTVRLASTTTTYEGITVSWLAI